MAANNHLKEVSMFSKSVKSVCMIAAFGVLMAGAAWAAEPEATAPAAKPAAKAAKPAKPADDVAVFDTSKGRMVAEFWEKDAPQTVANFKKLARQGFYNGTGFHRIMKGFMIQGGDPNSKNPNAPDLGTGGPGYNINDEFNSHLHVKGVLSMAHTSAPNSGGSQFFIMHGTSPGLDGKYTAFGHLIAGMDVLDKIANTPTGPNPGMAGENSKPLEWTTIKSVRIIPRAAYTASAAAAKKGQASKAATKSSETKAGMGTGAGMSSPTSTTPQAETAKPAGEAGDKAPESQATPQSPGGTQPESGK
jgi:peptidyl-prolyl cis-trans isomerase B (cyclophilin B)